MQFGGQTSRLWRTDCLHLEAELGHTRNFEAACFSTICQIVRRHISEHSCIRLVSFVFSLFARSSHACFGLTSNIERSGTVSEKRWRVCRGRVSLSVLLCLISRWRHVLGTSIWDFRFILTKVRIVICNMTLFWVYTNILEYHTFPIFTFMQDVYSPEMSTQAKEATRCHNS